MSQFQIILISVFAFFIIVGVAMFAGYSNRNDASQTAGEVVIWGTMDRDIMEDVLKDLVARDKAFEKVKYQQQDEQNFDALLTEALAEDGGPDVFLLSQAKILKHQNKIVPIPYASFSERDFKDYFIREGELYLVPEGVLALPFLVDPLVMYWNRQIFTNAGLALAPKAWDEFFSFAKKVTARDQNNNILTSAVALGGYANINNAKEIITVLILQTGNPIALKDGTQMKSALKNFGTDKTATAEAAVRFYTEFSDPVKETYSWHSALPNSKQAFLAGDLALYFGFASELEDLRSKNANLDFDVATLPQTNNLRNNLTFGKMQGLAISKKSKNVAGAFKTISMLIQSEQLKVLGELTQLPPVARGLLAVEPLDPYQYIFFKSALAANAFLDPDEENMDLIFQEMVEALISGKRSASEAVARADDELNLLLNE